jgi:SAM-dependent methyltransferase
MSGFTAEWLSLREPHDLAARNFEVLAAVTTSVKSGPLRVVDLACGAGSTVRALHRHLPTPQHWDLVDHDPALLALARSQPPDRAVTLNAVSLDLSRDVEAALGGDINLITTSALLDLVSEPWLHRFARTAAVRAVPVYAALTYNGVIDLSPADSFDAAIVTAVNAHQRTDKGFGAALGPSAAGAAVASFEALGYSVVSGPSDWMIGPNDRAMQTELFEGWAKAARELEAIPSAEIDSWLQRRRAAVNAGRSTLRVGHVDFFAFPSSMR